MHFAPRTAYKWRRGLAAFLPAFEAHHGGIHHPCPHSYSMPPKKMHFATLCLILTGVGVVVGLSLVGHYEVTQPCTPYSSVQYCLF